MTYSKKNVQWHMDGMGPSVPAVNVKVRAFPLLDAKYLAAEDPEFTIEWVNEHLDEDELDRWFWIACDSSRDMLQEDAHEIFGSWAKLYSEGRSAGWIMVDKIRDTDDWDAIELGKWRKFERYAHDYANNVPAEMLSLIELNVFQPWQDKRDRNAALDAAAQLPILANV